tara:strand:+ start:24132 stop:26126 length:1995 start_codon:yes stop_codon:yes gene_type:complete
MISVLSRLSDTHTRWLCLAAAIALPLLLYWLSLPRSLTLEDAGLFQLVCHQGGISHPPGYPLFTLACQGFVALTWFDNPVIPANLLSAIFAAGACGVLFLIAEQLGINRFFSALIAVSYGASQAFWGQAIIVEVYSLGVLTFLICFYFGLRFSIDGDQRWLYCLALGYGLALSNHWPVVVLSSPAILLLLLHQSATFLACLRSVKFWLLSVGLFLLGLSPYLTLLQSNPEIAVYGPIESLPELLKYVSRSIYADGTKAATLWDKWQFSLWLWSHSAQQFGWLCVPIILLGIWQSFLRLPRLYAVSLIVLYLGTTQILNLLLSFTFEYRFQSVFNPYPVIAYSSLAIWLGFGAQHIAEGLVSRKIAGYLVVAVLLCLPLSVVFSNYGDNTRSQSAFVEGYGETVLAAMPADAILFVYGDYEVAVLGYLQLVKGIRPDVELREWHNLVLSNRMMSPLANPAAQKEKREAFISAQDRPVFTVSKWDINSVNQGLFYRVDPRPQTRSEYVAGFEPLLDLVTEAYQQELFFNAQEHELAYSLLFRFGRHYTQLLLDSGGLPADVVPRYEAVRSTFPGALATLEQLLLAPHQDNAKRALLKVADSLLLKIDEARYRRDLAYFYYYYGQIQLMVPADEEASQTAFRRSVETYPERDNPAFCHLQEHAQECE